MDLQAFERAVQGVPWHELKGAYGISDGSARRPVGGHGLGDVPGALLTLAAVTDTDDDDAQDALEVLRSHAWHQGDIFEVTARVVPLVFELLRSPSVVVREDLAHWLAVVAESAARRAPDGDVVAEAVLAALAPHGDEVVGWTGGELEAEGLCIAAHVPASRGALLAALETRPTLSASAWLALATIEAPPPWVLARAARLLTESSGTRGGSGGDRVAAALLLARVGKPEGDLAHQVEAALAPGAVAALGQAVDAPFDLTVPAFKAPFDGPLLEGRVLFAGAKLVTVRLDGLRNVNLPWPDSGLAKGDVVRVGLSPHGAPRVAVHTGPDGTARRADFT